MIKTGLCSYSGLRIYPGHGIRFIRNDAKIFIFADTKNKNLFSLNKNPRKTRWTQVYRRVHRKGATEEVVKKRTKRVAKSTEKAIGNLSIEEIRQKRNQKPEVRAAAREAALREAKEKNKAKAASKAATDKPAPAKGAKPAGKSAAKSAPKQATKTKSAGKGAQGGKGR